MVDTKQIEKIKMVVPIGEIEYHYLTWFFIQLIEFETIVYVEEKSPPIAVTCSCGCRYVLVPNWT